MSSDTDNTIFNAKSQLLWKILSASLIPALVWVNAISNDVAVLKSRVDAIDETVSKINTELSEVSRITTENSVRLQSIHESLIRIHDSIKETRGDLRALNTRLLNQSPTGNP